MFIELKTTTGSVHIRPELFSDIVTDKETNKDGVLLVWLTYIDSGKNALSRYATQEEFDLFIQRLNEYFNDKLNNEVMCRLAKG